MRRIEEVGLNNPVYSEMPEVIAQFAPCSKQPNGVSVSDDHWPHDPFGFLSAFVPVTDTQLPPGANPGAGLRKIEPVKEGNIVRRRTEGRFGNKGAERSWDCGRNLRQEITSGVSERSIPTFGDPLCAENRCLQLLRCQHQGRHIVPPVENVSDAHLTTDRDALACQISNVTVDGADRDVQLLSNRFRGNSTARAPQDLDNLK